MRVLAALAFALELLLWVGLAILALSAWSWLGAIAAFVITLTVWALFMAPKGRWRLPPWPRALIALGLCLVVGVRLVDVGWPRYGAALILGGAVLGVAELVLPDFAAVRRDPTPTRHPYGL